VRRFGACLLLVVGLGACKASAAVTIRVRGDGTGTVTVAVALDDAARRAVAGSALTGGRSTLPNVPLGDLRAHGWSVGAWRASAGGGATIALTKSFTGESGLASVLAELDGRAGALRGAKLERSRSLLRDRDSVSVVADLRHLDAGVAGDRALAARLRAAGVDVDALDRGLTTRIGRAFALDLTIVLPDGARTEATLKPGATRTVSVASTSTNTGRIVALVAAAGAALLGVLLFLIAALNLRRARRF